MSEFEVLDNGGNDKLPNATAVLVLGICSIVGCWLYAVPGIICGIIALALNRKNKQVYMENPGRYRESFKLSNAGKICAIIGVSISGFYLLCLLFLFSFIFGAGRF